MNLVPTRQGNHSLRVACSDGTEKTVHSLYDPVGEASGMVDAFAFGGDGMIVVLGLGLGYHLDELRRRYPHARIVVVEAMPEILDLCREHGKGTEPSDKVRFLVGMPPAEAVAEISRLHLKAGLPRWPSSPSRPKRPLSRDITARSARRSNGRCRSGSGNGSGTPSSGPTG